MGWNLRREWRKISLLIFLKTIVLIFFLITISPKVYTGSNSLKDVLVIYDSPNIINTNEIDNKIDFSFLFSQQLGHFKTRVDRIKENEYKAGFIEKYDYIFYLSLRENKSVNDLLLTDLLHTSKKVIWYGEKVEELIKKSPFMPVKYTGTSYHYKELEYNNKNFNIAGYTGKNILIKPLNKHVKTYGIVCNGLEKYPLVLNWKNYWLMTGLDTYQLKYLIFSDILHEIFTEKHKPGKKVYLRIEDIHPGRSPENLRKIADYLEKKGVPFMAVVIPVYINPQNNQKISLTSQPELVQALKYMEKKGGSIVQHGYTHQFYEDTSGEGFEFWDIKRDKPLKVNYQEYIYKRVTKGLNIFTYNDLYPLAFIPPHYAMPQTGYDELKKYFSTVIGQIQTSDGRFNSASFPYRVENTNLFNRVLPEHLGYIASNKEKSSTKSIIRKAKELSVVRDVETGVFFHPFIDIKYLFQVVNNLREMGYSFSDLRDEKNWVKIGGFEIKNFKGIIYRKTPQFVNRHNYINKKYLQKFTTLFTLILSFLIFFVILILIYKYYYLTKKYKRVLFEEEIYK